ncbi:hypothetical protein [Parapedobacter sp. 10938]|uniref:hypothetical protein n=1 Tax=Parapedobacter flavus TaxID=3110225 RepID=UPI002DBEEB1F|nr:hypothetical protein [Parapedobacter sp. 10938]MEC3880167.1 hypothetical protein [Parapedobacter sp. 10938]
MKKVLFILNNAPNYRDVFLRELGKHVDLTVMSRLGKNIGLNNPQKRENYRFIELKERKLFGLYLNPIQFTFASKDFDVLILGVGIREPFVLLNLLRKDVRKISFGHIYSYRDNKINNIVRQWSFRKCDAYLVHSEAVRKRLLKEVDKPIYSFNNTYFYKFEIQYLPLPPKDNGLNILWVGRYRTDKHKLRNIIYLLDIASRNSHINLMLVGTGMVDALRNTNISHNVEIVDEVFNNDELKKLFEWSHVVMNPGHMGLLIANAGRFGRAVILDSKTPHSPEVQLAYDANQLFIDFDDKKEVDKLISELSDPTNTFLKEKGEEIVSVMKQKYNIEYMLSQFLSAINES